MEFKIGDTFSKSRKVTDELVRGFADLSGDHNPIHLDDKFAAETRFGQRIAHGMLSGAMISAVLGGEFSSEKIVYLSQTMRFVLPVYIGDVVTTTATIIGIREDKKILNVETICTNQDQEVTLTGEAKIMILD